MTSNAIQIINTHDFSTLSQMADIATSSGYVKVNKAQAMFIMLKGTELGISPLQALDGINIIQGKPTIAPQLMLALINRSSELQDIKIDSQETECVVTMIRKGRTSHTERFSMADAQKMGLTGKDNYVKQAKTMLKWRAVSACARIVFPDVIQGVYTPEEMGADVVEDDNGEIVVTHESTPQTPAVVQIPATTPAPVVEEIKHDPNEWVNGNVNAFLAHWLEQGMTHAQIKAALKINDRWSEWKGTVKEAAEAVEAYRKPKTLPPDVEAAQKAAKPVFDGVTPPAAPAPAVIPDEATLRRNTLARLEGEAVTLGSVEKLDYVRGKGKAEGWKWLAHAQILEADDSEPRVDVTLFPEDVAAIKAAGHNFPMTDGPVYVPVVLHIEDNRIRINRETIEKKDTTPIAASPFGKGKFDPESQKMFDSLPGLSDAAKHQLEA